MEALSDILDTTGLFYYITMHDYERRDKKRKPKPQIVRRINPIDKKQLVQNRNVDYESVFDFKQLRKEIAAPNNVESYDQLFALLSRLPIGQCLTPSIPINIYFSCRFINGNFAWISKNENGHYRYFSKMKDGAVTSFDLLDLIEIVYGLSTLEAVDKAVDLLSLRFMEEVWKKEQKEKYIRNYQFLISNLSETHPALHHYLKDSLPLVEAMNAIGTLHIHKKEYSYKGQNVFFASSSYIAQVMGCYTASKVAKLLNLFASLGFIEKVPTNKINPAFLNASAKIADLRLLGNMISYYIVPSFEEVATEAEKRAQALKRSGIHYSNGSKALLSKALGKEFADSVYVQTVQKNKRQESRKLDTVQKGLEENFTTIITEIGYATKGMILVMPVGEMTEKQKKHHLNQMWTYLIEKYQCEYIKPTKEMKDAMQLTSLEYVAIPKGDSNGDERQRE